jgi:hypothetical protein
MHLLVHVNKVLAFIQLVLQHTDYMDGNLNIYLFIYGTILQYKFVTKTSTVKFQIQHYVYNKYRSVHNYEFWFDYSAIGLHDMSTTKTTMFVV